MVLSGICLNFLLVGLYKCFCFVVLGMKSIKLLLIAKIERNLFVVGELLPY